MQEPIVFGRSFISSGCVRFASLALVLAASAQLAGCSDSEEDRDSSVVSTAGGQNRGGVPIEGDRRIPFSPANDLEFAEFFVAHHEMAIHMAEEQIDRGENAQVRAMAQAVVEDQTREVDLLRQALAELGGGDDPSRQPEDPHVQADMGAMSMLPGAALDEMFLLDMIPHHAAGLPVAHRAQSTLQREDLRRLANDIADAQAREVGEMHAMLEELGITDAGEDMAPGIGGRTDFGLVGDRRIPLTPADDIEFVDFFITHHEMAIMMAQQVVARGEDPEVRSMAEAVIESQTTETEQMRSIRATLAGSAEPPAAPPDPIAEPEMAEMMETSGSDLDRMFLVEMIPHHAAGLPTAHRAKPHVQNETLRAMADDIYQTQAEEIGSMRERLVTAFPAVGER